MNTINKNISKKCAEQKPGLSYAIENKLEFNNRVDHTNSTIKNKKQPLISEFSIFFCSAKLKTLSAGRGSW